MGNPARLGDEAWRPPRGFGFEHGIENRQQPARGRDERHFGRFPGRTQAQIEGLEHGVAAHGGDGGNVKHSAQVRTAAIDLALTTKRPTVAVKRRHSRQGRG